MGVVNTILCPQCVERLYPRGVEEKLCTHGCRPATCTGCGAVRGWDEKPYWSCLGDLEKTGEGIQVAEVLGASRRLSAHWSPKGPVEMLDLRGRMQHAIMIDDSQGFTGPKK